MPELPEVETTRRGLAPHVENRTVTRVAIRQRQLRWLVPEALLTSLPGQSVESVNRRAKYLLFETRSGTLMIHLGMSGSLRLVSADAPPGKHDHADFLLDTGMILRFHDPRRFGSILWLQGDANEHPLLRDLGPEPLTEAFSADYLHCLSRKRRVPVKSFIMNSHVVVGVGNIYANEALFMAGIHPRRQAGRISKAAYEKLVPDIQDVLAQAIRQGGTTLRDFVGGDGKPGYFKQSLAVYGRAGQPCIECGTILKDIRLGQRSTVYCKVCQR